MRHAATLVVASTVLASLAACADDPAASSSGLRLNELQAIGSHNSYHTLAGAPADPAMNYVHAPLGAQLDAGARHFELDIHRDPDGKIIVYHVKTIDEATTCRDLADCLGQLRAWSDAHPHHHALVVNIEPKDDLARLAADSGGDPAAMGELLWDGHIAEVDALVRVAWPDRLVTPAEVRGDAATLRAALDASGWPTIEATRGELLVVLNDSGALRAEYRAAHPDLDGALFVFGEATDDDAGFLKADNPRADPARVAAALAARMIVRTRADGDTVVDPAETEAALTSGAQLVSTDYEVARDDGAHPGYRVPWPGTPEHPSRCNPVTAPPGCRAEDIE